MAYSRTGCSNVAACDISECDGDHLLSYTCNECENTYCTAHRLPEDHDCTALRRTAGSDDEDQERFATGLQDKPGKRGITSRDDETGSPSSSSSTTTSSSPTETESASSESNSGATDETDGVNLSRHGHGSPNSMEVDDSQTVGTAEEQTGNPSPDVEADGSISTETTTEATGAERTTALDRFQLWAVGVVTTASTKMSNRARRLFSWLWWLLTGVARLSGAGATLVGGGWLLLTAVHVPPSGLIQLSPPSVRPVLITVIGLILVIVTARVDP